VERNDKDISPTRVEFIGVRADGDVHALVLRDNAGREILLPVDRRLLDAVRNPKVTDSPRPTDVSDETVVGPREIQALIRSGMSAEDVADEHGLELQKVQRFEMPVLMEREHMADRARTTELRRAHGSRSLGDIVTERLSARGDDLASLEWDSWKRPDGRWTIVATWLAMGAQIGDDQLAAARWIFDPIGRTLVPEDAAARSLVDDSPLGSTTTPTRKTSAGGDPYDEIDDDLTAVVRATSDSHSIDSSDQPAWTPVVVDGGEATNTQPVDIMIPEQHSDLDDVAEDVETIEPAYDVVQEVEFVATGAAEPDLFDDDQRTHDDADGIDEPAGPQTPAPAKSRGRRGRSSVPSWDEILLGTQGSDTI
jgi:hypothetical protein